MPKHVHAHTHTKFCLACQCDFSLQWHKRSREAVTSVKLHPGETNAVTMHWADESPRLAQTPSFCLEVSRERWSAPISQCDEVLDWTVVCLVRQRYSIILTCFPIHELACYHTAIHINNKFIHSWTFAWQRFNERTENVALDMSLKLFNNYDILTLARFNKSTASCPSSKY